MKRTLHRIVSMLTRLIARSDAVAESGIEYNADVEYEYEYEYRLTPEYEYREAEQEYREAECEPGRKS